MATKAILPTSPRNSASREPAGSTAGRTAVGGSGGGFGNQRVDEVRRRIARGYYHSLAVRHKIAADVGRVLRGIDRL